MSYRRHGIAILSLAAVLFVTATASSGSLRRSQSRVGTQVSHETAFAALGAVGDAEGWGRAVVRDDQLPSGLHRTVQVWLFDMSPRTEYLIEVNGDPIGAILTRSSGSGILKLQSTGKGHDPVPEDLPPAAEVTSIMVYAPGPELVLEGYFTVLALNGGLTIYEEEIDLEDVDNLGVAGMAKVEMKDGGHQEFKSHATGLEPGSTYTVVVDSELVGALTADAQGQARIHLEDPDDNNPLPTSMKPVSDIVSVEWRNSGDVQILFGQFTGAGVCEHLVGTVSMINPDGFTLETADGPVSIVTTDATEWEDVDEFTLAVGDKVKVEGCWNGNELIAEVVELKSRNEPETCSVYVGEITSVSGENFLLTTESEIIEVLTTDETELVGFGDREPAVGDKVKVDGCWNVDVFVADVMELKGQDGKEQCSTKVGIATAVSEYELTLETNKETINVTITDETVRKNFRGHELGVGDKIKVKGCWSGDDLVADEIQLIKAAKLRRVT